MAIFFFQRHNKKYFVFENIEFSTDDEVYYFNLFSIKGLFKYFFARFKLRNMKYIFCGDPLAFVILKIISPFFSRKCVFYSIEMYGYQSEAGNLFSRLFKNNIFKVTHSFALERSKQVIFCNNLRREFYINSNKKIEHKSFVLENYFCKRKAIYYQENETIDESIVMKIEKLRSKFKYLIIYPGCFDKRMDDSIDRVFSLFSSPEDCAFVVFGKSNHNCENNHNNLFFYGSVNFSTLCIVYRYFDFGYLAYSKSLKNTDFCAPIKLYEYDYYGIRVLATRNSFLLSRDDVSIYIDAPDALLIDSKIMKKRKPNIKLYEDEFSKIIERI